MKKVFNRIKNNSLLKFMSIAIIALFISLIARVTYAFFAPSVNSGLANVRTENDTVDAFKLEVGDPLTIDATPTTLPENGENLISATTAKATLRANSTTNEASYEYFLYLNLTDNTFIYSDGSTAEIILTVIDPNGNAVTSVEGLEYGTYNGVEGFDVTTKEGLFLLSNSMITSNSSTNDTVNEWQITLTYLNLPIDQSVNYGHSVKTELIMQKEEKSSGFANYIIGLYTQDGENNLYYHDGVGTYTNADEEARDYSYRYSGGDYTIAPAYQETYKKISKKAVADTDALISRMCGATEVLVNTTCNEETQYFYLTYEEAESKTQYVTYKEAVAKTISDGYLLETPVKNYVCFGSNAENCPQDNLYRIIGVIDNKVKLIKADYATKELLGSDGDAFVPGTKEDGTVETEAAISNLYRGNLTSTVDTFYWNLTNKDLAYSETSKYNIWRYSELNKTNLNKNFLNNIGSEWSDKIATTKYYVSGGEPANIVTNTSLKTRYDNEVGIKRLTTYEPYETKVGLMYVTDYLYASSPNAWKTAGNTSFQTYRDSDWIHLGGYVEWTVSHNTMNATNAFNVNSTGYVPNGNVYSAHRAVRPVFSLTSSVEYAGGTGSASDPFRIA